VVPRCVIPSIYGYKRKLYEIGSIKIGKTRHKLYPIVLYYMIACYHFMAKYRLPKYPWIYGYF